MACLPALLMACLALLAGCADPGDPGRCGMREVAALPVLTASGIPVVPASIDDAAVAFILDTGAFISTLSPDVADRFGLGLDIDRGRTIKGVGGTVDTRPVTIERLTLDHAVGRDVVLAAVGSYGGRIDGRPIVGLLGADILSHYDVDLDLPGRMISLYDDPGCNAGPDFPPPGPDRIRFELDGQAIILPMTVPGYSIEAVLDSGASMTTLTDAAARSAGIGAASGTGPGLSVVGIDLHRLDVVRGAPLVARIGNTPTTIAPMIGDIPRTLIGNDVLRRHRVWISYSRRLLLVWPQDDRSIS